MTLPEEMMKGLEEFTRFHDNTCNKTRKLTWQVCVCWGGAGAGGRVCVFDVCPWVRCT